MNVDLSKLKPAQSFFTDHTCKVYIGDDEFVYRLIKGERVRHIVELIESSHVSDVYSSGLIEAEIVDEMTGEYEFIIRHPRVMIEAHWSEWCTYMIRDALKMVVDLCINLCDRGLMLDDIKPGNIMFDFTKPLWVDWGAINAVDKINFRSWGRRFWKLFVFPCWLMTKGRHKVGRELFSEVPGRGIQSLIPSKYAGALPLWYRWKLRRLNQESIKDFLIKVRKWIREEELRPLSRGWESYRQSRVIEGREETSVKEDNLSNFLSSVPEGKVLDLGANLGLYSLMAESIGHKVIATDYDDECVCKLYDKSKRDDLNIFTLNFDVVYPLPNYGIGGFGGSAYDRLESDYVVALAIVHHIVGKYNMSIEGVIKMISRFSKEYLVFDFPNENDVTVSRLYKGVDWPSFERVEKMAGQVFNEVEVLDSHPDTRRMFICKK